MKYYTQEEAEQHAANILAAIRGVLPSGASVSARPQHDTRPDDSGTGVRVLVYDYWWRIDIHIPGPMHEKEDTARREAEERASRESKERAQREAEERASRESKERAQREAEERARR